jgi:hypothetical protein
MNHENSIVRIANAKTAIDTIEHIVGQFLANCQKNAAPREFTTKLEVAKKSISINAFGHIANAMGRTVNAAPGEFAQEYIFRVDHGGQALEVWRCYLMSNGKLVANLETKDYICDYNEQYVAKHICGPVLIGVLNSSVYTPQAVVGD